MSCSKDSTPSDVSIDISLGENGLVTVVAKANGANSYRFSFEENSVYDSTSDTYDYTYSNKGNYTIGVWAFFDDQKTSYSFASKDVEITNATGESTNGGLLDLSETVTEYEVMIWFGMMSLIMMVHRSILAGITIQTHNGIWMG